MILLLAAVHAHLHLSPASDGPALANTNSAVQSAAVEVVTAADGLTAILSNPHFKGATPLPMKDLLVYINQQLSKYGLQFNKTLLATSICPDQINNKDQGFSETLEQHFGRLFPLGGLAGAPFAGKTGFAAFMHHVPEGGSILVVYGAHVGVSPDGEVGKYLRPGQEHSSAACGAAIAAYNSAKNGSGGSDPMDLQQNALIKMVEPYVKDIDAAENAMVELAYDNFQIDKTYLRNIVSVSGFEGKVLMLGGVLVNNNQGEDLFIPLGTDIYSSEAAK